MAGRSKLNAVQIREICQLYLGGGSPTEIATTYGVSLPHVINIGKGKDGGWATTDLRASLTRPVVARAKPAPVAPLKQEEPVQTPTQQPHANGTAATVPTLKIGGQMPSLVTDLADALEILLDYAGKPLPKYLTLDTDALRRLIEQARA